MERWDRQYYLHNVQGQEEHQWNGVAYQEGNYLYMVDGTRYSTARASSSRTRLSDKVVTVTVALRTCAPLVAV
jgi:hypothetical protein